MSSLWKCSIWVPYETVTVSYMDWYITTATAATGCGVPFPEAWPTWGAESCIHKICIMLNTTFFGGDVNHQHEHSLDISIHEFVGHGAFGLLTTHRVGLFRQKIPTEEDTHDCLDGMLNACDMTCLFYIQLLDVHGSQKRLSWRLGTERSWHSPLTQCSFEWQAIFLLDEVGVFFIRNFYGQTCNHKQWVLSSVKIFFDAQHASLKINGLTYPNLAKDGPGKSHKHAPIVQ